MCQNYSDVENGSMAAQQEEVYLFISLFHFGHQVVPLLVHSVDEGVQLSAGVLK